MQIDKADFVIVGAGSAGAVLAGLTANHVGVRPTLWIMLAGLVLSSWVLLLGPLARLRDLPSRAPAATSKGLLDGEVSRA